MKVYIHGKGSISAAGADRAAARATYARPRRTWTVDDVTGLPVYRIPAQPDRPAVAAFVRSTQPDRATELGLYAADEAIRAAGWEGQDFSILVGCSRGPTAAWEAGYEQYLSGNKLSAKTSPRTTLGGIGFALAEYFGAGELASSLSVTCSSGFHALLHGVALLRSGMAERVLVGGAEAPLTEFTLRQMAALRITAPVPQGSDFACRPLDAPATGMALGEGAAFFALSAEPGPFEVSALGFARESAGSATGITAEGLALQETMRLAREQGGGADFIVAHAPGTARGDAAEEAAIAAHYRNDPADPVVTSFKWATGHTFGASGPLALDGALSALEVEEYWGLPYRPLGESPRSLGTAWVNATGFGGNAVTVGVRRC